MIRYYFIFICWVPSLSFAQSVELFAGHNNAQGDIQWLKPFSPESKFLFYNRNRFTVDYDNKTTYFISGITAYQIEKGFGIANEMLITMDGWLPKAGVQYLFSSAERTVYAWLNAGYLKETKYGFFFFARFQPPINEKWSWYLQLELANNFNNKGNEFSAQRPRIGVGINGLQFGIAGDLTEVGKKGDFTYNVGFFLRKEF